jgi:thioredoxin-related protein
LIKEKVMKQLLFLLLVSLSCSIYAQKINWLSMEDALAAHAEQPKKIFIDAYTDWCGPCKLLDKNTFQNSDVANYVNANYYAVKFNAEGNETINFNGKTFANPNFNPNKKGRNSVHEMSRYFGVRAYPTMLFLDEELKFIGPVTGYKTPKQLELFLKGIASDDYKQWNSKEALQAYEESFNYEFIE